MKKLFLSGLVALGLLATGCSSDDNITDPTPGANLNGYLTLTLNSAQMSNTKTTEHTPGREVGTGKEIVINDVTVVLTDANDKVTSVVNTTIASGTTTQKFQVAVGTHKVYALVNNGATTPVTTYNLGEDIEKVIAGAAKADILAGFKNGSFFMTNARHKGQASAGIPVSIGEGEEKVVSINVDRVAARVEDLTDYTADTNKPAIDELPDDVKAIMDGVEVIGFVPLNLNQDFNLIQTWGLKNAEETADLANDVLLTPVGNYVAKVDEYKIKHPNGGNEDISTPDMYVKKFYSTENRPTITFRANGDPTSARGTTTGVIYRVRAMKDGNPVGTFYSYNDKVYTDRTELDKVFAKAGDDISAITDPIELRAKGILVYVDGIMYYTYFIKDPNTNYQLGSENYYGVFRNSIYKLKITKIANLGDDVPENDKKPTDPIDPDEAFIKVELTINDWVLNEIGIEF